MRFGLAATAALVMAASLPTQGRGFSLSVTDADRGRREAVRPPPRAPGRNLDAAELVAMRAKNARRNKRRR